MAVEIKSHTAVAKDDGEDHYITHFWVELPSGDALNIGRIDHCWWDDKPECEKEAEEYKTTLAARLQELKGLL